MFGPQLMICVALYIKNNVNIKKPLCVYKKT